MAKAVYSFKDLNDWARHYGLPEVRLPDDFPFTAVLANRCALVAEDGNQIAAYSLKMFAAIWAEKRNCNDPAVVSEILSSVGLDPAASLARAGTDEIKARLKQNTEEAVERGAFGVPTYFVGREEMFVGNDRLHFVESALTR